MASYCAYDSPTPEYYTDAATCTRQDSFFGGKAVLPEGAGYGIVIGFGVFFSLATGIIMKLNQRYGGLNLSSEFFNTAGRNVKTGLTASVIVSQWTWAATLLQSSNVAYQYGVSGPFWYASGATIQVLLFGMLAIQVKRYAPNAHTICEIIDARWGSSVQKVYLLLLHDLEDNNKLDNHDQSRFVSKLYNALRPNQFCKNLLLYLLS